MSLFLEVPFPAPVYSHLGQDVLGGGDFGKILCDLFPQTSVGERTDQVRPADLGMALAQGARKHVVTRHKPLLTRGLLAHCGFRATPANIRLKTLEGQMGSDSSHASW
jgi:hypothetical protein